MKYIRKYQTVAEYEAAAKERPHVGYVVANDTLYYLPDNIIDIPDPVAKAIFVANFDLDGDGEISKEEALSATTEIHSQFYNNKEITDLSFFYHFKNITLSSYEFYGTSNCLTINCDGCEGFSSMTNVSQFFGNSGARNISLRNCNFSSVTVFDRFLGTSTGNYTLTVDLSGSVFPDISQVTSYSFFVYYAKNWVFYMNGCNSTSLETIKAMIGSGNDAKKTTIHIDGKVWTCPAGTWVENDE